MTITDPDCLSILAGIRANPDDDTARLVWADRLDEIGEHDRAGLIRVQVILDRSVEDHPPGELCDCPHCTMCQREAALLVKNDEQWRTGPKCGKCSGKGKRRRDSLSGKRSKMFECEACDGSGDAGGLLLTEPDFEEYNNTGNENARMWTHQVTYHRGTARIRVSILNECIATISAQGVGNLDKHTPSDWLLRVVTHHPDVTEVWCDNPVPDDGYHLHQLPRVLFNMIEGHENGEEIARAALARKLVTWARTFIR